MILSLIVAGIALFGVVIFALSLNSRPRGRFSDYYGSADLGLDSIPDRPSDREPTGSHSDTHP